MKKIASFTIDHTRLLKGIYLSRKDITDNGDVITTFDIRMTEPNREPALTPQALHAMEHLAATFLRNHHEWSDKIVYWGPMGCCTGNYLLIKGDFSPRDIVPLMKETMEFIAGYDGDVPGATPMDCGNYSFMDKEGASLAAKNFVRVLELATDSNFNYPA